MATNQLTINNTTYYGTATFKDVNDNKCYIGSTSTESMTVDDISNYQMLKVKNPDIYTVNSREIKYTDVGVNDNIIGSLYINNLDTAARTVDFVKIYWDGEPYIDDDAHLAAAVSPGRIKSGGSYSTNLILPSKGVSKKKLRVQIGDFTAKVSCSVSVGGLYHGYSDDSDGNGVHNILFETEGSYMRVLNAGGNIVINIYPD